MDPETWRILLVDDDKVDRMAVRRALSAAPIQIDECERAADVYARLPAPGNAYDCLMIDCYLPDANGVELIRNLRAQGVSTPILAVTGQSDESIEDALIAAGASDYLPKQDWQSERLMRRIRYAIRVGRTEANYASALAVAQRAVHDRDELLSIVSHDLRNPLNAIRIAADELIDPNLEQADRALMVSAVQRSLRRADRLICDLLDVSRIDAGGLTLSCTPISAKTLLEQGRNEHALLAREGGLELTLDIEPNVGMVMADRERVLQVIGNLLSNAVRYARDTGMVMLAARNKESWVEISVVDRGPGIPADQLPHVFDRFFQASRQRRAGAGLGLAIVKGIVEAHGGSIKVHSAIGQGTRFAFTLPQG